MHKNNIYKGPRFCPELKRTLDYIKVKCLRFLYINIENATDIHKCKAAEKQQAVSLENV